MLLEQISMFSRIAKEQSISKAAQAIHISQPALSQQMQRLEEELGVKLFERSNRGIILTRAGEVMQKYSEQFLETYSNLKEELASLESYNGTFRIAATPVACNYALPCSLFKVNHKYPSYSFSLNSVPSTEVIHRVLSWAPQIILNSSATWPSAIRSVWWRAKTIGARTALHCLSLKNSPWSC